MDQFLAACEGGNFYEVRTLLETSDASLRSMMLSGTEDDNGWSCLHWAAWHSDIMWTNYLLAITELDINAKDQEGKTAFHVALKPRVSDILYKHETYPVAPLEVVKLLLEANINFIFCRVPYGIFKIYPMDLAMKDLHIDIVKLFIRFFDVERKINGYNVLHIAARHARMDCIRYLVNEIGCDIRTRTDDGHTTCCLYFKELLSRWMNASPDEVKFAMELLSSTHKSPAEAFEVCFILLKCLATRHGYSEGRLGRVLFLKVVKLLLPLHRRKNFVEKILQFLPNDYSLTLMTLFETILFKGYQIHVSQLMTETYLEYLNEFKDDFMRELFALFFADESFFHEYITEIVLIGWSFNADSLMHIVCKLLQKGQWNQKVFNFVKIFLRLGFEYASLVYHLPSPDDHLLKVFLPLSHFEHVPTELMRIFRVKGRKSHYNFNESENSATDYKILVHRNVNQFEVVSLKNLSRMSVRKYVFNKFSHYDALSMLYSLHIPNELRQFLCYNYSNYKF